MRFSDRILWLAAIHRLVNSGWADRNDVRMGVSEESEAGVRTMKLQWKRSRGNWSDLLPSAPIVSLKRHGERFAKARGRVKLRIVRYGALGSEVVIASATVKAGNLAWK